MNVSLYTITDDPRVINKTLGTGEHFTCELIYPTDMYNPSIRISASHFNNARNYMLILELGRFYYITDVTFDNGGAVILRGRVDVLNTYKTAIKALNCNIVRQEQAGTSNMIDSQITMTPNKTLTYLLCKKTPFNIRRSAAQHNYVLCIAGGEQGV